MTSLDWTSLWLEKTKVVVRRLPPYLREDDFKAELERVASGRYTWFRFSTGKISTKRVTYARAYLNFIDAKSVVEFKTKFDGFVFVGARGAQYRCVVEYAPYQRLPKQKSKPDPHEGTLETDSDYLEFLESLDKAPTLLPSAQRQYEEEQAQKLAAGEGEDTIVVTPLMEFIIKNHFKKASSRSSGRGKGDERRRHRNGGSRSKRAKTPPKVLLKTRPPSKKSESQERSEKKMSPVKEKSRKAPRVRDGHQTWVPRVMKTGVSSLDSQKDSQNHTSVENAASARPDSKGGDGESGMSGRGRNRRNRSGKGHPSKSPNVKAVWIRKSEKQEGE